MNRAFPHRPFSHPAAGLCIAVAVVTAPSLAAAAAPSFPTADSVARRPAIQLAAYSPVIARLQSALNRAGYDAGPVDGLMGSKTRQAIESYQRDNGLLVTGQPSRTLLDHLSSSSRVSKGQAERSRAVNALEERRLRRLQRRLSRLGYDVDDTGQVDKRTEEAIRSYQRDHDLLVTGDVSDALYEHIRQRIRAGRWTQDRSTKSEVSASTIADIQLGLRRRGYEIAAIDGRLDGKTQAAISDYQRRRGVDVTGVPTEELAEMLREGGQPDFASRTMVRRVQQALNARGYQAGPADGVMGPATRRAIHAYQSANNLPATGTISHGTAQHLGVIGAGAARTAAHPPGSEDRHEPRITDDFGDGNFTANPSWQVLSGEFRVENGMLTSSVESRVTEKEFGEALLRGVVGQALGLSLPGRSGAAAIVQPTRFTDAFKIVAVIGGDPDDRARINFGPYLENNASRGYRLIYDSAGSYTLTLSAVSKDQTRVLASTSDVPRLGDGKLHSLEWSRDLEGRMTVKVDGKSAFDVSDRSLPDGGFDGLSLINAGGDWRLDGVTVTSPPWGDRLGAQAR